MLPTYDDLKGLFSDEEHATLARLTPSADGSDRNVLAWAIGWILHVDKLDRDRSLPLTDHSIWTEHDLVAALFIRDFLARDLGLLPAVLADRLSPDITAADERFKGFTVPDSGNRVARIAHVPAESDRGWWWYRVPADGPVAYFLSRCT